MLSGPVAGGGFAEHSTWRWVFYLNFPFCALGLAMIPFVVRLRGKRASLQERLTNTDWLGAFLFISSTCSFLVGITSGGTVYPWGSYRTVVPIVLGVAGIVATLCWERFGATHPFLRVWLFKNHAAMAAYICAVLQGLMVCPQNCPFRTFSRQTLTQAYSSCSRFSITSLCIFSQHRRIGL